MKGSVRGVLALLAIAGLAAAQEKKKVEVFVQNTKEGVEMRAPITPGKDQLWEAKEGSGGFFTDSAAVVTHRVDSFSVEVNVTRKAGRDPLREAWVRPAEIAKNARENFTKSEGDKEPNFTDCKLVSEDPKAKLAGLPGNCCSHRIILTDRKDGKHELIEYFVLSSDVLYRVTMKFNEESYKKYFAKEGQFILNNVKRCKVDKKN